MFSTILRTFPTYSETFVYREIEQLLHYGIIKYVVVLRFDKLKSQKFSHEYPLIFKHMIVVPKTPFYLRIFPSLFFSFLVNTRKFISVFNWGISNINFRTFLKAIWIAVFFSKNNIKFIHIHFISENAEIAEVIRQFSGIKYGIVPHARDIFVPRKSFYHIVNNAEYVIHISKYNQDFFETTLNHSSKNSKLIHLGVCHDIPLVDTRHGKKKYTILSVGRFVEKKGHKFLISAFAEFHKTYPESLLFLVGDGIFMPKMKQLAKNLGIEESVIFFGSLSQKELIALYSKGIDLFILPVVTATDGDKDGIPVSLMEAMMYKVPVISTFVSGIPELVKNNENGLLVPEKDATAILSAMIYTIENPEISKQFVESAYSFVNKNFNLKKQVEILYLHLKNITENSDFNYDK